jgi:hypothetical protein
VVDDELGDDLEPVLVRLLQKPDEVELGPVVRMHAVVVGDVVTAVTQR